MKYNLSNEIMAIIPARGGSKGVPRKNIKFLRGFPLLAYSIAVAKMSQRIDRVLVSTDDEEIAGVAKRFGAEVPFLRPKEIAGDKSKDIEFIIHALDWLHKHEGQVPAYLVHLRPTTPLRDVKLVDEAIDTFVGSKASTSLRSAHPAPESPFKWLRLGDNKEFSPFMPEIESNDELNAGRQSFLTAYIPDGYVDVLSVSHILSTGNLHGEHMLSYISPVCTEVDTQAEFELLEYELQHNGSSVFDFLQKYF